jgi:protocatechuate 3,4-dioxygenase beta subunit
MASSGQRALAIDTQHALFLSGDTGEHWQSIVSPWRGQAIAVRLVRAASDSSRGIAAVSLAGKVLDASGVAIRGASLVLHDSGTNAERSAVTDDDGRYQIDKLVPGIYSLAIQATGFNRKRIEGIDLVHAPPAVTDITLSAGSASETVMVTDLATADGRGPANVRQLRSATRSRFQITTDTGEFWLSVDGLAWVRQPTIPQEQ